MANLLTFPYENTVGSLALNVESVYRVDEGASKKVEFFHNVADSTGSTQVWVTTVEFTDTVSGTQLTMLEKAVRDVKQTPNGVIDISTLDDSLTIIDTAPFATATGNQPS